MNMDITWRCLHRFILSLFLLVFANACYAQIFTSITPVYYHTDLVGSPVAQTDEDGSILWKADRYPYGQEYEPDPNSFTETVGYAGHAFDRDTDLVYMQARYYDPLVGRFYGVDPQGVNAGNPITFNRYAYSANNPFSYRDPNGEWVETAWDVFNVSIGVASFADNYSQGNYLSATLDAVGLVFDTAAVIVPGLPAGAGNIIRASRAADEVSGVVTSVAKGGSKGTDFIVGSDGATVVVSQGRMRKGFNDAGLSSKEIDNGIAHTVPTAKGNVEVRTMESGVRNARTGTVSERRAVMNTPGTQSPRTPGGGTPQGTKNQRRDASHFNQTP
jgi:RHS repeat-associated protein